MGERDSLARRALSLARSEGLPGIVRGLARSVFWLRRYYLLELALDAAVEPEPPAGVVVLRLGEEGLGRLARVDVRSALESRLRYGDDVLFAELEGRLVGWIWLTRTAEADPTRVPVRLREGEIFGDGLRVLPDARRRGVATALLRARNARARALGADTVVSLARRSNTPVLGLQRRFGTRIRARLLSVVLLGRVLLVVQGRPKGLPDGFNPSGGSPSVRVYWRSRRREDARGQGPRRGPSST